MASRTFLRIAMRLPGASAVSTRALSSAAATEPPVKLFGIHARYASAAYVSAAKEGATKKVEDELTAFAASMEKSEELAGFVKNPTIARDTKVAAVEKLFEGSKTSHFTINTLVALAANARLAEVDKVIDAYSTLMKAERKEVDAVITSATELTAAQTKKISKALEPHLGAGETVKLTTEVDPALLGGLTVQIGDKYLDLSAATKIAAISRSL